MFKTTWADSTDPNEQPQCIVNLASCSYTDLLRINVDLLQTPPPKVQYTLQEQFQRMNKNSNGRLARMSANYFRAKNTGENPEPEPLFDALLDNTTSESSTLQTQVSDSSTLENQVNDSNYTNSENQANDSSYSTLSNTN